MTLNGYSNSEINMCMEKTQSIAFYQVNLHGLSFCVFILKIRLIDYEP